MEFNNNIPIYMQVMDDLKRRIIIGELRCGDKLASARELAVEYSINPNTANRIYKELETEGVCFTRRGLGTYVTEEESMVDNIRRELSETIINEFIEKLKSFGYSEAEIIDEVKRKLG